MNLLSHFDRIYIINLSSRRDRRQVVAAELAGHGLEIDDCQVRWTTPPVPEDSDGFSDTHARRRFDAHLAVLDEAIAADLASVVICEDDLRLDPRTDAPALSLLWPLCTREWDFTYLGHGEPLPDSGQPPRWGSTRQALAGTACYALSRRVMRPLRDHLQASRTANAAACRLPLEAAYSAFRQASPERLTLIAMPSLATSAANSGLWPRWLSQPFAEHGWLRTTWRHRRV